jgi:hypothetical protein
MNKQFKLFNVGIAVLAAVIFVLAGCEQTVTSPVSDSGGVVPGTSLSAGNPSVREGTARVGDVTITGSSYSALVANVVIDLSGNSFIAIGTGTDVSSWFTNLPDGLTAVAKKAVAEEDTEIIIAVSGTPLRGSAQVMAITIPADMLYEDPTEDIVVATNPSAKYAITATITNEKDLQIFSDAVADGDVAQNAKLQNSATVITVPPNSPFIPISMDRKNPYTGTFDGSGGTIDYDQTGATAYLALFGINGGTIKNLTVTGSVTLAKPTEAVDYIAGVVAYNDIEGTITRVVSHVTVNSNDDDSHNIGGIAGFNGWDQYNEDSPHYNQPYQTGGTISQCRNEGNVIGGFNKVGGIVGENAWLVQECVNTGTVTCAKSGAGWPGVGGIAGRNGNNNRATEEGQILNCYNWGTVNDESASSSSHNAYAGITGWCSDLSTVTNSYTTGIFTQSPGTVGGTKNPIIGMADTPSTTMSSNNFSLKDIFAANPDSIPLAGTRRSDDAMKSQSFVTELNNGGGTYIYITGSYPKLNWEVKG